MSSEPSTTAVCPGCGCNLSRNFNQAGVFWHCGHCGGRAVGIGALRKVIRESYVDHLWALVRDGAGQRGRPCPICLHSMLEVTVPEDAEHLRLDVCRSCLMVWFDPQEFCFTPRKVASAARDREKSLPLKARELMAVYEHRLLAESQPETMPYDTWKTVPALFGLPVEVNSTPLPTASRMTWSLAALVTFISLWAFSDLRGAIADMGFIPGEAFRNAGATFITSFFLHGGALHLVSNMYFLVIFGNAVESVLGKWEWLLLVILATLTGDLLHLVTNPHSDVPCIGASGGISGLIAFYALRFPKARLAFLSRFGWLQLPAWIAFGFWILLQCLQALAQWGGHARVAHFAHLGGALAGFLLWLKWKRNAAKTSPQVLAPK